MELGECPDLFVRVLSSGGRNETSGELQIDLIIHSAQILPTLQVLVPRVFQASWTRSLKLWYYQSTYVERYTWNEIGILHALHCTTPSLCCCLSRSLGLAIGFFSVWNFHLFGGQWTLIIWFPSCTLRLYTCVRIQKNISPLQDHLSRSIQFVDPES